MVFSSLTFLFFFFLPATLIIYYLVPKKAKNIVILLSGLIFYAWGEPIYVLAMILSTFIDYTAGRIIAKYDDKPKIRKACLIVSLVMNLGLLATFKYLGFIIESFNGWFGWEIPNPNLPLPIGISFFTFQSMSYTIDLYRRNINVQKSAVNFMAFVTLFPQIVAGPIVRYEDVQREIDDRTITERMLADGISRFITGMGKKVLIANNIGALWTQIKAMEYSTLSAGTAWLGILAFTFQIYFDFSGYSDMAIGLGKMMGFNFPENFNYPYQSKSVSEFWRRWHITLGIWFRDYLYIPLGGSRNGKRRLLLSLFVVWTLTGLWHGAAWNFVLWGFVLFVFIALEKFCIGGFLERHRFLSRLYFLFLIPQTWVVFRISDLGELGDYFSRLYPFLSSGESVFAGDLLRQLESYWWLFALGILLATPWPRRFYEKYRATPLVWLPLFAVFWLCLYLIATGTGNPFLYARF